MLSTSRGATSRATECWPAMNVELLHTATPLLNQSVSQPPSRVEIVCVNTIITIIAIGLLSEKLSIEVFFGKLLLYPYV